MEEIIGEDCENILEKIDVSKLKNKSILLTGSNGVIGRYIKHCIYLANKYYDINCRIYCVSLHDPVDELDDENIISIKADLSGNFYNFTPLSIKECDFEEDFDYIFHAACYAQPKLFMSDKLKTIYLNTVTTKRLLDVARDNKAKFMFFSSREIYGDVPPWLSPVLESYNGNTPTTGVRAPYAESKRMGETICSVYRNDFDVDAHIIRICGTYGPAGSIDEERVLTNFIKKAVQDKKINMLDGGKSVKTYSYVADTVYMIFRIMLEGKQFIYNLGGKDVISIRDLADKIAKLCGNIPVIAPKEQSGLEYIGVDQPNIGLDISRFENEFGKVDFIDFDKGLERTIYSYVKR